MWILKGFAFVCAIGFVVGLLPRPPGTDAPAPVAVVAPTPAPVPAKPVVKGPTAASLAIPDRRRDKAATVKACEALVRGNVRHTSTFTGLQSVQFETSLDGSAIVDAEFSAKNSFGLELTSVAQCRVSTAGKMTVAIAEK